MTGFDIPPPHRGGPLRPLHFWHGLMALSLAIVLMMPLSLLVDFLFTRGQTPAGPLPVALSTVLLNAVFAGCAIWTLRHRGWPARPVLAGIRPPGRAAILAVAGVVPTGIFADEAVYHLHRFHPRIFSTEIIDYANSLFSSAPLLSLIALGIAISIGPAIGEELMFRGALLQTFRRDMPAGWAVLYSSILFGAIHFDWMQGTAAGIIGLYLGCVTVWSRSIYPAMTAHFFNNLLAVLLARTGTFGLSEAALTGYPLPVLIAAAPILLFVMYLLYRCRVQ